MAFIVGNRYSGFTLKKTKYLEEIDSTVFLFEHASLGCPLLAIKNSDNNKTFSVAFHTIPTDSTGVAHILEHSVLMGSKRYPVKDVFGEINKGGLTTYLNAMTGADCTYYPFATRNLKEYFNIMSVYCDVVFHPLLERSTFEQEGWHLHQEDEESPLLYQGVVLNEMKGAFSDPIRHLFHHIFAGLMPGSTYAHESGGDPEHIPDLSYEEFCAFHQKHYHPSNALFFLYGDAPLEDELSFLQTELLSRYAERKDRLRIVPGQIATNPVFRQGTYAVDSRDLTAKTLLAVATNVADNRAREENTAFQIIANILYNSDASPLKNSIVSSGLCKDFGGLYLAGSSYRTLMITYVMGSEVENRDAFLDLYRAALEKLVEQGLDRELVLAELNKYEFSLREDVSKALRGLDFIGKAMIGLKYDIDPLIYLEKDALLKSLRHKALHEGYFEQLVRRYLLDNPSRVVVTLSPDPEQQSRSVSRERERLLAIVAGESAEEKGQRLRRTRELIEGQQRPNSDETLALLPQLSLDDLTTDLAFHSVTPLEMFGQEVLVNELHTNRISYIDIGFDVSSLNAAELALLDVFGTIVTEIGTDRLDYQQFAKEAATCTGALTHSLTCYSPKGKTGRTRPVLWIHLKCLPEYLERALTLVAGLFSSVSFENKTRIGEIVAREFTWAEHSVQSEGYSLPLSRVFAHLSDAGKYSEAFNGVTSYLALKELCADYQQNAELFLARLQKMAEKIFTRANLILANTAERQEIDSFAEKGGVIVESLRDRPIENNMLPDPPLKRSEAFITGAEVVFAVQGGNIFTNGDGYNGHFEVLKTYLSRDYLWNSVRQIGGAYGCFVQFGQLTGNLAYVSYRDPQVRKTYEAYDSVPEAVAGLRLGRKALDQLIVGTYGAFDPLQSPAVKGAVARNEYLNGITAAFKKKRLEEIVTTTSSDLRAFADLFAQMTANSYRAIIGNRDKIEKDSALFDQITEL
ncbi:MAG: peptidase M16 [Deltaproteobacteria bacterium]|nr:MAG: peptidase M16 [Deltaproteobacteria bacterium]